MDLTNEQISKRGLNLSIVSEGDTGFSQAILIRQDHPSALPFRRRTVF
jgi:hypothetical protein